MKGVFERKPTKQVNVGGVLIGGDAPVSVQSMTNTDTRDVKATVGQIHQLAEAGCDIIRVAVLDKEAAEAIKEIKGQINIPLVADIHFDYRLALECLKNGVDKIRINPGNIGDRERVKQVVNFAKERGVPIRIGVNSGSLEREILAKYGGPTAQGMVDSALKHIGILEDLGFEDYLVSLKASGVPRTVAAYRIMSETRNCPLHVGVTEAGTLLGGTLKSAAGIGTLLSEGIGDTIRVSLTSDPINEVHTGINLLKALEIRKEGIEFISCPTCGRTKIDLIKIAEQVEEALKGNKKSLKIAVMGCAVNGPGEAREADLGIAGGDGVALLFKKGEIIRKIPQEQVVQALLEEIDKLD